MLTEITDVLGQPEAYVFIWRDGELYLQPAGEAPTTTIKDEPALAA